jgi:hypothetical protein
MTDDVEEVDLCADVTCVNWLMILISCMSRKWLVYSYSWLISQCLPYFEGFFCYPSLSNFDLNIIGLEFSCGFPFF